MKENKSFWDRYASDFDAIYGTRNSWFNSIINKLFRGAMKIRFDKTMKIIPPENVSVIDIGCGPGHYCFSLATTGEREILGIDFSEPMIGLAKEHAKELGLENSLRFEVVDVFGYEPGRKFDYSIMMGFVEYFEHPELVIERAINITNRKVMISFPADGGVLAFQRKLRYRNRCYLRLYHRKDIEDLMAQLEIMSYSIERIDRDYFVTINLN
jgi:2-polyprenyl-3-methyl-5-hydroxy-6-metoxy-1,4-benzoquinol methylase